MTISNEDYKELRKIAAWLNSEDPDTYELWERLVKVINNITE